MTGYYIHLIEQRDAVLAGARVSARDRARIMGVRPAMAMDQGGKNSHLKTADDVSRLQRGPIRLPTALRPAGTNQPAVVPDLRATQTRVRDVIRTVCQVFEVEVGCVLSDCRKRTTARARQAAMALAVRHVALSQPSIGRIFRRDHTTVGDALVRVAVLLAHDSCFAARYGEAERRLGA